jgi:3-hydroxyacyl-CoA dehydrogenase
MASGAKICAETAFNMNILDEIVEDLENAPLRFVDTILKHNKGFSRTRDVSDRILNNSENRSILVAKRHKLDLQKNTLLAHYKILECLEAVLNMSFEDGLSFEITAFADLLINDQSKGMIHAFFAERQTSKLPELRRAKPKNLQKIAVIGGGTMGSGITIAAMKAGLEVIMIERNTKTLDQGRSKVLRVLERDVQKSRLTEAKKSTLMQLYSGATDYSKLQGVDLVIEAVYEDMEVKKEVFKALDRSLPEQTILASNTSYLDIDEIASVTKRPQNVIGLHFFSPANIMRLLEIVVPERASDEVIATGFDLAKKMKKIPVRAGNCDGFIGNRILSAYTEVASFMMEDGASPYEIDQAVRAFGYPIGPYQMFDLAGGDIGWATRKRQVSFRDSDSRYVSIADRLCERGWFGQKTGRGFYRYDVGHQRGTEDPEVIKIVEIERNKKGIKPRKFSQQEILRRYIAAMVNEAANVLNEGFACRPSDIDVVKLFGYGFPRFRGGPMKYADTYGLEEIIEDINKFSQEDKIFWKPSPLLLSLVERGENFESLNV